VWSIGEPLLHLTADDDKAAGVAAQSLQSATIPAFVRELDNLSTVVCSSFDLTTAMHAAGMAC
jgi:hypothetical protein